MIHGLHKSLHDSLRYKYDSSFMMYSNLLAVAHKAKSEQELRQTLGCHWESPAESSQCWWWLCQSRGIPGIEESTLAKWEATREDILPLLANAKDTKVENTEPQGNPNNGNANLRVTPRGNNNSNGNQKWPNGHRNSYQNGAKNDNGGCIPQNCNFQHGGNGDHNPHK